MKKRFLLDSEPCPLCHGLGATPAAHEKYRLRMGTVDSQTFHNEEYDSMQEAFSGAFSVWKKNPDVRIEIIAPDGEIFSTES
jgi:hypothetical protein